MASGVGIYGDRGGTLLDEDDHPGEGFLEGVARDWERAANAALVAGVRVVNLRIGVVLSREGGVLGRLMPLYRCGLGSVLGSGTQYVSWITIDDVVRAIWFVMVNRAVTGPVNVVAPDPVTNREFSKTLGLVLGRPAVLRVPGWVIRSIYGQMAQSLLLNSTRALPRRLLSQGFSFQFPCLEDGLRHVIRGNH